MCTSCCTTRSLRCEYRVALCYVVLCSLCKQLQLLQQHNVEMCLHAAVLRIALPQDVKRVMLGATVTTVIHGATAGASTSTAHDADSSDSVSLSYSSSDASLACSSSSNSVAALYSPYQYISRKHCSEQNVLASTTTTTTAAADNTAAGYAGAARFHTAHTDDNNSSTASSGAEKQQRCEQCVQAGSKPRVKWTKAGVEYEQEFDSVVIATQAYVALASLSNPTDAEVRRIRYTKSKVRSAYHWNCEHQAIVACWLLIILTK
jgi:hypothetical protein